MPLQNFADGQLPKVAASWLNQIDAFFVTLFASATTAAQARTAITAAKSGANTDITSLASPAIAAATATTQAANDNSTKVATTAYADLKTAKATLTTTGDTYVASAASTPARIPATSSQAAHATTCDVWTSRETVLTGGAVTFTALAAAPYAGAVAWVRSNAAHIFTNGATFSVQGGATITLASGDWVRIRATTTSTFDVTVFKVSGTATSMAPITNSLSGDVALSNTGQYFTGPTIAQGTAGTWFASGTITLEDTAGAADFNVKLWDGTTVIASGRARATASNTEVTVSLSGFLAAPAGNIRISAQDATSTSGQIRFNQSANSKDSTVSAIRIA